MYCGKRLNEGEKFRGTKETSYKRENNKPLVKAACSKIKTIGRFNYFFTVSVVVVVVVVVLEIGLSP